MATGLMVGKRGLIIGLANDAPVAGGANSDAGDQSLAVTLEP